MNERTVSSVLLLKEKFFLMSLPVLLKIIHFVFSTFTISSLSLQYFSIDFSIFFSPSSLSDRSTMSSAHIRQLGCSDFGLVKVRSASNISGRSDIYILNSSGLSMQPCFTPWLTLKVSVTLLFTFIQALSLMDMFLMVLKKLPFMSNFNNFCNSLSRGIVSKALPKSMKQL